ncbi:hypothetical protein WJX77_006260 [Trebouxia sp. C0004]
MSNAQRIQRHHSSYTPDDQDTGIMRLGVQEASQASFRRQLFTDATIEVDGRVWAVHRATLACVSPVFMSMFIRSLAVGATVMVGAATISRIPLPRFPSFWK